MILKSIAIFLLAYFFATTLNWLFDKLIDKIETWDFANKMNVPQHNIDHMLEKAEHQLDLLGGDVAQRFLKMVYENRWLRQEGTNEIHLI